MLIYYIGKMQQKYKIDSAPVTLQKVLSFLSKDMTDNDKPKTPSPIRKGVLIYFFWVRNAQAPFS
ncbi:hypothetical protein SAMN05444673_0873 [Bacillus sp. OV166]|nr:hypothetical protein SAMN05444673_0873 [Bacillus sp. OV166]